MHLSKAISAIASRNSQALHPEALSHYRVIRLYSRAIQKVPSVFINQSINQISIAPISPA